MDISKLFGSKVFNDEVMRQRLPREVYESLMKTRRLGTDLDESIAEVVASAMKDWAVEQGATHFAHWFQPMTNITAGKHDSFISPIGNGKVILEFSPKELVQGEPDASSFPSGGLRATFEARGYTTWDPTSPAFVRDGTLYIPTAFCGYKGEALDTKTPLLRSMEAVNRQGLRLLRALGNTTSRNITPSLGNEQEYFLVDRQRYEQRLDLKLCGRTLFGAKSPKTQELDDHYCGRIRIRVSEFMKDLDQQLWELGVPIKTKHNEAAPAQHELAPVYDVANVACDHNQIVMEVMRVTAKRHGLACLLHEKPFAGVNGSGKHHNYSLVTDDGINLLSPGKDPATNLPFQLMLCAFIQAVDEYADLLRLSTATPGNDQRLGGYEAPPAIISIFLGEPLTNLLISTAMGAQGDHHCRQYVPNMIAALPGVLKDDSDRNRTSPFAFTGNKFEFRMVGSSQSPALANTVLNTMLAQVFEEYANALEQAQDLKAGIIGLIHDTMAKHSRIIFNGNNYTKEWEEEAARRGLPCAATALDACHAYTDPKNIALFEHQKVLSPVECRSRQEIVVENVAKVIAIEANIMLEMVTRQILPAVVRYAGTVAGSYNSLTTAHIFNDEIASQIKQLSQVISQIQKQRDLLRQALQAAQGIAEPEAQARAMVDQVRPAMEELRSICDFAETITEASAWPIPTYTDLMHRV